MARGTLHYFLHRDRPLSRAKSHKSLGQVQWGRDDSETMQCVNCQFENMPGLTSCVRCGSSLTLATATIDVHPPRAGRWSKKWRKISGHRRLSEAPFRLANALAVLVEQVLRIRGVAFDVPIYTALIPGWPQYAAGRRVLAIVHLASYVLFLVPTVLFLGSAVSTLCLGLAFSSHFSSVLSALIISRRDLRTRWQCGFFMIAIVALFVCLPMYRLLDWFGWPMELLQPMAGFQRGDVVLLERGIGIQAGDVIVYQPPRALPGYAIRGEWVGRVLAVGPTRMEWKHNELSFRGQPATWQPSAGSMLAATESIEVLPNSVVVLQPTEADVVARRRRVLAAIPVQPPLSLQQRIAIVDRSRVVGQVIWQTWPLARWGAVE